MTKFKLLTIAIISIVSLAIYTGCEAPWDDDDDNKKKSRDEIDYSALNWTYGGVNFAGAVYSQEIDPNIKNLTFDFKNLYYQYGDPLGKIETMTLSAWGLKDTQAEAICAVFFKENDGVWRGGKFDWISTSRQSRGLGHCTNYNGWKLDNVPYPDTEAAFVIVNKNGRQRSNVIIGKWHRDKNKGY